MHDGPKQYPEHPWSQTVPNANGPKPNHGPKAAWSQTIVPNYGPKHAWSQIVGSQTPMVPNGSPKRNNHLSSQRWQTVWSLVPNHGPKHPWSQIVGPKQPNGNGGSQKPMVPNDGSTKQQLVPWSTGWSQTAVVLKQQSHSWSHTAGPVPNATFGVSGTSCLGPRVFWTSSFGTTCLGPLVFVSFGASVWDYECLRPTIWDHACLGPWFGTIVWDYGCLRPMVPNTHDPKLWVPNTHGPKRWSQTKRWVPNTHIPKRWPQTVWKQQLVSLEATGIIQTASRWSQTPDGPNGAMVPHAGPKHPWSQTAGPKLGKTPIPNSWSQTRTHGPKQLVPNIPGPKQLVPNGKRPGSRCRGGTYKARQAGPFSTCLFLSSQTGGSVAPNTHDPNATHRPQTHGPNGGP